jgi:hypothetical protein
MAADSQTNRVFIVGGQVASSYYCEVWAYDVGFDNYTLLWSVVLLFSFSL